MAKCLSSSVSCRENSFDTITVGLTKWFISQLPTSNDKSPRPRRYNINQIEVTGVGLNLVFSLELATVTRLIIYLDDVSPFLHLYPMIAYGRRLHTALIHSFV